MSLTGIAQTIQTPGAAPPTGPAPSTTPGDAPRQALVTPPSMEKTDPDSPFLREGRAPGTWVMVRPGTPVTAPAVKPDFAQTEAPAEPEPDPRPAEMAPLEAKADKAAAEQRDAAGAERKAERRTEDKAVARSERSREAEPDPAPVRKTASEEKRETSAAFDKIANALKVIRGGEPMPWEGLLAFA